MSSSQKGQPTLDSITPRFVVQDREHRPGQSGDEVQEGRQSEEVLVAWLPALCHRHPSRSTVGPVDPTLLQAGKRIQIVPPDLIAYVVGSLSATGRRSYQRKS